MNCLVDTSESRGVAIFIP